jgi:hypothetical protein
MLARISWVTVLLQPRLHCIFIHHSISRFDNRMQLSESSHFIFSHLRGYQIKLKWCASILTTEWLKEAVLPGIVGYQTIVTRMLHMWNVRLRKDFIKD